MITGGSPRFFGNLHLSHTRGPSPRLPGVDRLEVDAAIGVHPVEKGDGSSSAAALGIIDALPKSLHTGPGAKVQKHTWDMGQGAEMKHMPS